MPGSRGSHTYPWQAHILTGMDINEAPKVLEGQTSIEDLLVDLTDTRADACPLQGCPPGLEDVS